MSVAGPLIVLLAFGAALFLLSQPFWPGQEEHAAEVDALRRADLEAARIAKYREIRDAALDHDTGKLSDADWRPIDARLRSEAVAILDELDGLAHVRGDTGETREGLPDGAAVPTPGGSTDPIVARDAARATDLTEPVGAEEPEVAAPAAGRAASDGSAVPGEEASAPPGAVDSADPEDRSGPADAADPASAR